LFLPHIGAHKHFVAGDDNIVKHPQSLRRCINADNVADIAAAVAAMVKVAGDVTAITGGGSQITLEQSAVKELSNSLRGRLLLSGYDGYDQ